MQWIEEGLAGQPVTSDQVTTLPLMLVIVKDTIMMDALKWHLQLGSSVQHSTGTWMRGCVCLPAKKWDSFSYPWLLRTSALLVCISGDLPLRTPTTSLGSSIPSHSSLVIRSASCSSARTGERGEKGEGGQSHISTHQIGNTTTTHKHTYNSGVRTCRSDGLVYQGVEQTGGETNRRDTLHHAHTHTHL